MTARPRKTPCASCPYRVNAPSGVWAAEEYEKLPEYDRPTGEQPQAVFMCHHGRENEICAGWVGHADPIELLALRLAVTRGDVDPSVFDYTTTVPLFKTGLAAAVHGVRDLHTPDEAAVAAIEKIVRLRNLTAGD